MSARDIALLIAAVVLLSIGIGGFIATADMQPCWPNCGGTNAPR